MSSGVESAEGGYTRPTNDIQKLQNSIKAMEVRGMTSDPRYSQARSLHQSLMAQQGGAGEREGPGERPPTNFQNFQALQLRAQIMAYRLLGRHQPLPPQIALAVTGKRGEPSPVGSAPRTESRSSGPPSSAAASAAAASPAVPAAEGEGVVPDGPRPLAGPGAPEAKPNRVSPNAEPAGTDPVRILQERESRLADRIAHRIDELNLPMNIVEDAKTKAEIELRALRLLNFQRSLRAEVVACTKRDTTLETAINVKDYERTKQQGLREARATECLEKEQRVESERKRRAKHSEYINAVLNHSRDMQTWHKANIQKIQKVNKEVLAWHANAEREQKKEQDIEKCLWKLMAEDEEGYRRLIDLKDKRLAFLLSQTEEHINQPPAGQGEKRKVEGEAAGRRHKAIGS